MPGIKSRLVAFGGPIGGYKLCRLITRATPKIMMYHRFSEVPKPGFVHHDAFERQVEYMKKNFNLMTMNDLITSYHEQGSFPPNAAVITVDDGYRDFYDVAFPVLKKHNASATFYVTTRFVDGDFWLWPDAVKYIIECSSKIDLSKMPGDLDYATEQMTDGDRKSLWDVLIVYLLSVTEDEKVRWIKKFAEMQAVKLPEKPTDGFGAVNWPRIKELDANNIEIGVHTQNHPSLGRLEEPQLFSEIQGTVDIIQRRIGHAPKSFCFPNGQPSDYTESVKKHIKDSGCESSVTAFYDKHVARDLFELRRFGVSDGWQEFVKSANGVNLLMSILTGADNIINARPKV